MSTPRVVCSEAWVAVPQRAEPLSRSDRGAAQGREPGVTSAARSVSPTQDHPQDAASQPAPLPGALVWELLAFQLAVLLWGWFFLGRG